MEKSNINRSLEDLLFDYLECKRAARYGLGELIEKAIQIVGENKDASTKLGLIIAMKDFNELSYSDLAWDDAVKEFERHKKFKEGLKYD